MIKLKTRKNRNTDVITYKRDATLNKPKESHKRYDYATHENAIERVLSNQEIINEVKSLFE